MTPHCCCLALMSASVCPVMGMPALAFHEQETCSTQRNTNTNAREHPPRQFTTSPFSGNGVVADNASDFRAGQAPYAW